MDWLICGWPLYSTSPLPVILARNVSDALILQLPDPVMTTDEFLACNSNASTSPDPVILASWEFVDPERLIDPEPEMLDSRRSVLTFIAISPEPAMSA